MWRHSCTNSLPPGVWIYNAGKTDYHSRFWKRAVIFFCLRAMSPFCFAISLCWLSSEAYLVWGKRWASSRGMWLRCYEWMQSPRSQLGYNCHRALEQRHFLSLQPESIHLTALWDPGSLKPTDTFLMRGWTVNRSEAQFWLLTYMKRCCRISRKRLVWKMVNVKYFLYMLQLYHLWSKGLTK